jgi:hypothetical protein
MRTVQNESELPTPESERASGQEFLRLKSDPTILKDCGSGDLYRRADGKNWKHPAYVRARKFELIGGVRVPQPWSALSGQGAYCDSAIYSYSEKAAA